ncbi:FixH family protein [Streptomyces sp. UNOB3_S3]|uniref:FixH family protein n=1 Tax=Streptomyces sp. UNOB3_S3 TaxID=2871682 RepID=UPI001E5E988F|nr:FixH family protein [Streptomyces sp. UNOB3_S3]MCC3775489.1 copper resistance protein CopC [Streptomyces sp. UNOB3_S3]
MRTPTAVRRGVSLPGAFLGTLLGTFLVALLCVLTLGAGTASAHAALTATDPADGSVVATAPARVTLTFSEGVLLSPDSVRVLDPRGERVDQGRPQHDGGRNGTATVALRAGIADGTYTVAWQAVSADSHPVAGAFTFSVGAPSKTTVTVDSAATRTDPAVAAFYAIGRYAAYAGFVLLVGGCVFAGVCRSSRAVQRVAVGGWITLFVSTVALLLLRGAFTSGKGMGSVLDLSLLGGVLSTKPGAALLSRLLLLSAAAVFLAVLFGTYAQEDDGRTPDRTLGRRRDIAWGLGVGGTLVAGGLAATWALAEHASAGLQPWLAMPVDVAHLLGVAVWLGGLAALLATLWSGERIRRSAVARFSRTAFVSVCVLVATGLYQSWRQVGSWDALTGTEYGRWLLVKAALVVVMVGIALLSRRWTGRLADAPEPRRATARKKPASGTGAKPTAGAGAKAAAGPGADAASGAADAASGAAGAASGAKDAGAKDAAVPEAPKVPAGDPVRAAQLARQRAAREKAAGRRARDADTGRTGLRRSVLAEAGVAVVVLAVTTALTGTQPGRAETEQRRAAAGRTAAPSAARPAEVRIAYDTGGANGKGTARVTVDPARTGANTLTVTLTDPSGRPVDVPELTLSMTEKEKQIGPLRAALERQSAGLWKAKDFRLPMAGDWQLSLTVRTSDIDQVTEIENVKII